MFDKIVANKILWTWMLLTMGAVGFLYIKFKGTQQKEFTLIKEAEHCYAQKLTDSKTQLANKQTQNIENGKKDNINPFEINFTIKQDQTLFSIARKYNITVSELMALNQGLSPKNIRVGQTIKIAIDATHYVQNNETLNSIARKYNIKVSILKTANDLEGDQIRRGQKIIIPKH